MSHQAIDRPPGHVFVIEPSKGRGPAKPRCLFDDPDPLRFFVWHNVNIDMRGAILESLSWPDIAIGSRGRNCFEQVGRCS